VDILHVSECYTPTKNGVVTSLQIQKSAAEAAGHRVAIIAPKNPKATEKAAPLVLRLPSWWSKSSPYPFFLFPIRTRDWRKVRQLPGEVVHIHHPFFAGSIGAKIAKQRKIPYVLQFHSDYVNFVSHFAPKLVTPSAQKVMARLLKRITAKAQVIIVPSETTKKAYQAYGIKTQIEVVPTALPPAPAEEKGPLARATAREKLNLPSDVPVLLFVGRLFTDKNLRMLMKAFNALPSALNIHLVLIGEGELRDELSERLQPSERVRLTGSLPYPEVLKLFAAADLFVFPSFADTQGLVLTEALDRGVPCLVVDEGAPQEYVQAGVDSLKLPNDPAMWTEIIAHLFSHPEELAKLKAGAENSANRYTPHIMWQKIEAVYKEAIASYAAAKSKPLDESPQI